MLHCFLRSSDWSFRNIMMCLNLLHHLADIRDSDSRRRFTGESVSPLSSFCNIKQMKSIFGKTASLYSSSCLKCDSHSHRSSLKLCWRRRRGGNNDCQHFIVVTYPDRQWRSVQKSEWRSCGFFFFSFCWDTDRLGQETFLVKLLFVWGKLAEHAPLFFTDTLDAGQHNSSLRLTAVR